MGCGGSKASVPTKKRGENTIEDESEDGKTFAEKIKAVEINENPNVANCRSNLRNALQICEVSGRRENSSREVSSQES